MGQRLVMVAAWSLVAVLSSLPAARADTVNARFPNQPRSPDDTFVRMFPRLPAFTPASDSLRSAMQQLGAKAGVLDALDDLSDPIQSIVNQPVFSPLNFDNPEMTAGMTFFGQFIDHDLSFDRRSPLNRTTDPARTVNFRSAAFDLDSVYGRGPEKTPELYDTSSGDIKFAVEEIAGSPEVSRKGAMRHDVPRDASGGAIIGDSRNDENVLISQLHLAFLRLHNVVVDRLRKETDGRTARGEGGDGNGGDGGDESPERVFERARRLVQWHYQWCVVNEFLPATIGRDRVEQILREGNRDYHPRASSRPRDRERDRDDGHSQEPRVPIEFSVAAYRFGHSQIRPSYRLNFGPDGGSPVFVFVFDDTADPLVNDPDDLRGGRRAPRRFVDWQTFFDFGDGNVRPNKIIDAKLSSVLFQLPGSRGELPGLPSDGVQSLASRNLMRHVNFGLPSGQAIARHLQVPVLSSQNLSELEPLNLGLATSTPLWYYILKEAEVMESGKRMGPVGARIVGEVFIGLLNADPDSYLSQDPKWEPTLPAAGGAGTFRITDLLTLAGVVMPLQ